MARLFSRHSLSIPFLSFIFAPHPSSEPPRNTPSRETTETSTQTRDSFGMETSKSESKAKSTRPALEALNENNFGGDVDREALAIENILPGTKNVPKLYKEVVDLIKNSNVGTVKKWAETTFYRNFRGWADAVKHDSRPGLDFFIAALAVHSAFLEAQNGKTKFLHQVRNRGLIDWANAEIQRLKKSSKKRVTEAIKPIKIELNEDSRGPGNFDSVKSRPKHPDMAIPSIEATTEGKGQQDTIRPSTQIPPHETSPFQSICTPKRNAAALSDTKSSEPATKVPKLSHDFRPARIVLRDAETQTDGEMMNNWIFEQITKHAIPDKTSFENAISQQTKDILEILPVTIKQTVEAAVANELAVQASNSSRQIHAGHSAGTEVSFARPAFQTVIEPVSSRSRIVDSSNYRYESVPVEGRGSSRAMPPNFERLLELNEYRISRHGDQRRG